MPQTDKLTCYLVSVPGSRLDALRIQLEAKHVACFSTDESVASPTNAQSVLSLIKRSDFVSTILPQDLPSNLILELGIAIGLNKPLLLFAEDPSRIPIDLASLRAVKSDLISTKELDIFLEAFLRTIPISTSKKSRQPRKRSTRRASLWRGMREEFSRLQTSQISPIEFQLEALVERAFKKGGFTITSSPGPDFGADFALASPALNKAFGLPILVEVKNNTRSPLQQSVVDKLSQFLRSKRGGAGLIVVYKDLDPHAVLRLSEPIVIVPVNELLGWLEAGSFTDEFIFAVDSFWARKK